MSLSQQSFLSLRAATLLLTLESLGKDDKYHFSYFRRSFYFSYCVIKNTDEGKLEAV